MKQVGRALVLIGMVASGAMASPVMPNEDAGFEIGNGGVIDHGAAELFRLDDLDECAPYYDGRVTEVFAPASDGGTPRTRLRVDVYWMGISPEEALEAFSPVRKDWTKFFAGDVLGLLKEVEVRKDWNRLELELFRDDQKFQIRLEGNKSKSRAYSRLATSLVNQIKGLTKPVAN